MTGTMHPLRIFLFCLFAAVMLNCSDSLDKTPRFFLQNLPIDPHFKAIDAFASATVAHDLTVAGGVITPTTCTLYIRMNWCNGETYLSWGETPRNHVNKETINIPPSCPDSTSTFRQFLQPITGLTPNTTYYLHIYGVWYNAGVYPFEWDLYDTITTPEE